jgi:hypothetical protein
MNQGITGNPEAREKILKSEPKKKDPANNAGEIDVLTQMIEEREECTPLKRGQIDSRGDGLRASRSTGNAALASHASVSKWLWKRNKG